MKKLLVFIVIIGFSFSVKAQEGKINWISFEEAIAAQAKEPKKMMIDMFTVWCGPCRMLDRNTFQHKDVAEYVNKNYYAVKFNAEGNDHIKFKEQTFSNPNYDASKQKGRNSQHQLAAAFGVTAYPTVIFLDEDANLLLPVKGYHNPKQLEIYLKVFATNAYKKIASKEDFATYQKEFKSDFKE